MSAASAKSGPDATAGRRPPSPRGPASAKSVTSAITTTVATSNAARKWQRTAAEMVPTPPTAKENGWQVASATMQERSSALFNCNTLSDIVFHVGERQVPAHTFVLASSSPVFYHRLFEAPQSGDGGRSRLWRLSVLPEYGPYLSFETVGQPQPSPLQPLHISVDFPFEPFFQFLRYCYTDEVHLTFASVLHLVNMSDDFKLPGLFDQCLEFLRAQVRPDTALRELAIARNIVAKAVVSLWRDAVERQKAFKEFMGLSMYERQRRIRQFSKEKPPTRSRVGSKPSSIASRLGFPGFDGQRSGSSDRRTTAYAYSERRSTAYSERRSTAYSERRSTVLSVLSFQSGGAEDSMFRSIADMSYTDVCATNILEMMDDGQRHAFLEATRSLYQSFYFETQGLIDRCWKCIKARMDIVLSSPDWLEQDLEAVQSVLRVDTCNISEIELFRAVSAWTEHQCKVRGFPATPAARKRVLGPNTVGLIRFGVMTLEQLQWEVVPTGLLDRFQLQQLQQSKAAQARSGQNPPLCLQRNSIRFLPLAGHATSTKHRSSSKLSFRVDDESDESDDPPHASVAAGKPAAPPAASGHAGAEPPGGAPKLHYAPVPGDMVDAMLAAKLWRSHVDNVVREQENVEALLDAGVPLDTDTFPVLCGRPDRGAPRPRPGSAPSRFGARAVPRPQVSPMLIASQGLHAGVSPPPPPPTRSTPQDFDRIAAGLYRFRGERVLEMVLEGSEPVVYDHGSRGAALAAEGGLDREAFRLRLGIPAQPTPGTGVPLDAFLIML